MMAQRDLVGSVFQSEGNSKSATRPKVDKKDPWANTPRLNLLLLGADDGVGRTGVRTDTVIVASIDTKTGDTALISLSRNWMRMPFPDGLAAAQDLPGRVLGSEPGQRRAAGVLPRLDVRQRPEGSTRASSGRPTTRARTW